MSIIWEEPAPQKAGRTTGRNKWEPVANELRANPDRWALLAENVASSTATAWRKGAVKAFRPAGEWEFTAREVGKGKAGKIYGRYIGK